MTTRAFRNTLAAIIGLTLGAVAAAQGQTPKQDSARVKLATDSIIRISSSPRVDRLAKEVALIFNRIFGLIPAPVPPAPPPVTVVGVTITPKADTTLVNTSISFSAIATYSNGTTGPWFPQWGASGGSITVSGSNTVYTAGSVAGAYVITATGSGRVDSAAVLVLPNPPPPPPPPPTPPPPSSGMPELPRLAVDATYPVRNGATINVLAGGNLQTAINSAACGDDIVLAAGASFTGNFLFPDKGCTAYIVIRGAGPCPAIGTRITTATAAGMPELLAPGSNLSPVEINTGAGYYRFVCLAVTAPATVIQLNALVRLHPVSASTVAQLPHHIILDRVYLHGHPTLNLARCLMMNSAWTAVVDSYLSECHAKGSDAQAIVGWTGPGPYLIRNNFLEGSGENVMFGGADPSIVGLVPSDITIQGNHVSKPMAWKTSGAWTVKNLLELKLGKRVLIEGNLFENTWPDGQVGYALLFKSVNQSGNAPWSETSDVTVRDNVIRNAGHGINIAEHPEPYPVIPLARVLVENNLIYGLTVPTLSGSIGIQLVRPPAGVTLRHNTVLGSNGHALLLVGAKGVGTLVMENNLLESWIKSADGFGYGTAALDGHLTAWTVLSNLFVISYSNVVAAHPPGNLFTSVLSGVGFVDFAGGNFRLSTASLFKNKGTDGKDPGADIDAVLFATRGALTGIWP